MKKLTKISSFIVLAVLLLTSTVFAGSTTTNTNSDEITEIGSKIGQILNAIAWVGYAIAFGMLIFVGIKYMMSAANERADVKKGAVNYIIGVIIIASAATIANVVSIIAMGNTARGHEDLANEIVNVGKELGGFSGEK